MLCSDRLRRRLGTWVWLVCGGKFVFACVCVCVCVCAVCARDSASVSVRVCVSACVCHSLPVSVYSVRSTGDIVVEAVFVTTQRDVTGGLWRALMPLHALSLLHPPS